MEAFIEAGHLGQSQPHFKERLESDWTEDRSATYGQPMANQSVPIGCLLPPLARAPASFL